MAAAGTKATDAAVALLSLASVAPDVVVLLLVLPEDVGSFSALAAEVGAADGGASGESLLLRRVRMYSWTALSARLPPAQATLPPSPRRFLLYAAVLAELEAAARGQGDDDTLVLFSNLPASLVRPPDVLFMCDTRDVAFQRDPFPGFYAAFADEFAAAQLPPLLLVAAELNEPDGSTRLGHEDWNRDTMHTCYGYLGEALTYESVIYCAGTSFANPAGLAVYVAAMEAGFAACNDMHGNGGTDQGVHNALTHTQSAETLAFLSARAAANPRGPYADRGPFSALGTPVPRAAQLLDAIAALHRSVIIRSAPTEQGLVCTMALVVMRGKLARDALGSVLAIANASLTCAVVHQYDREEGLYFHYRQLDAIDERIAPMLMLRKNAAREAEQAQIKQPRNGKAMKR